MTSEGTHTHTITTTISRLLAVSIAIVPRMQQAVQVLLRDPHIAISEARLLGLVEKLHALLRWACPRRRERRTSCNSIVVNSTISQEVVQIVRLACGKVIDAGRQPVKSFPICILAVLPEIIEIDVQVSFARVELSQISFLVAPGCPTAALPPSARAKQRRVPSLGEARHIVVVVVL